MSERKFKQTLRDFEAEFNPQDWTAMQEKLHASTNPIMKRSSILSVNFFNQRQFKHAAVWLLFLCAFAYSSSWLLNNLENSPYAQQDYHNTESESTVESFKKKKDNNATIHVSEDETTPINENSLTTKNGTSAINTQQTVIHTNDYKEINYESASTFDKTHTLNATVDINSLNPTHPDFSTLSTTTKLGFITPIEIQKNTSETQKEEQKTQFLSRLGVGIPHAFNSSGHTKQSPMIIASTDIKVSQKVGIGAYIGWHSSTLDIATIEDQKQNLSVGARATYSIPLSKNIEVYGGLHAGTQLNLNKVAGEEAIASAAFDPYNPVPGNLELSDINEIQQFEKHKVTTGPIAGVRVKIKNRIGAFLESTPGLALVQAGIHVQLK